MSFEKELEGLINRYSKENVSSTPDFVLAEYLSACLAAFETGVRRRDQWYGRDPKPTEAEQKLASFKEVAIELIEEHQEKL